MTKEKLITRVFVPIVCASLAVLGASAINNVNTSKTVSETNIILNNINGDSSQIISANDLKTTASIVDSYKNEVQKKETQAADINDLQNRYNQSLQDLEELQAANEALSEENEKLREESIKMFSLLHPNNLNPSIKILSHDHLEDLQVNDSENYSVVDDVKDYNGDSHSVSYRLDGTAFVEYHLAKNYDMFNANIITTTETGAGVLFDVEIYLDGSCLTRIDDITRDTNLVPLGPITVTDVDSLEIKVIKMEGNRRDKAICYITDDSLYVAP